MRAFLSFVAGSLLLLFSAAVWAQHPVGAEFQANTYTTNPQTNPSVAVDAAGSFLVVWTATPGANFEVFGQRFANSGVATGSEFRINTYTTLIQRFPSVASDPLGNFVVVWESYDQDGSYLGIFGRRFSTGGSPVGPEFRANSYVDDDQSIASVAADEDGDFVVVWQSLNQDGDSWGIFGQRFSNSGAKQGAEFQVHAYETDDQIKATVAADAAGNFIVAWQRGVTGTAHGIFGQRFSSGGAKLGTEFQISNATTGRSDAAIASDGGGAFLVVWQGAGDIFGKRFSSSGGVLGTEFRVNSFTTGTQQAPSITSDVAGDFVVVWQSSQDSGGGVFGQRFSNSGAPQGPEFRVNTYTTNSQGAPSVAAEFSGEFVVAWAGTGAGDSYGIFGQIFDDLIFADGFEVLP